MMRWRPARPAHRSTRWASAHRPTDPSPAASQKERAPRIAPGALCFVSDEGGLGRLLLQRALRLGDNGAERFRFVHRDVREYLAVERHAGEVQRVDELAVGEAFGANRGVDA